MFYDFLVQFLSPGQMAAFSTLLGCVIGWLTYTLVSSGLRKKAESEAKAIIQEAEDQAELARLDLEEKQQEIETQSWTKVEPELLQLEERIEELETLVEEKLGRSKKTLDAEQEGFLEVKKNLDSFHQSLHAQEQSLNQLRKKFSDKKNQYVHRVAEHINSDIDKSIADLAQSIEQEALRLGQQKIEMAEEDAKEHAEMRAKTLIDKALARFQRAYCSERGIAPVYFETDQQRKNLDDAEGINVKTIEEVTGCEIYLQADAPLIGVSGFDPVRRELARRLLERCLKERKSITPDFIKRTAENIKREIISTIKRDGDNLAKELSLTGLHPEVRQMMGSLRYRYSFTQNQYFHCAEVGWLCGLLSQELGGIAAEKAKRAGMLHDLGKSMDHELEGGHAVIGANFIEARNEAPDIVHAVRAHHFDEQPSTDLAYMVIAADAISGARPGARRSTVESYNQKVSELEAIAKSFEGVTDCFILSGGRECRVIVNGKKITDLHALEMGKNIATRIENECNYPGQIKVVVVRETVTVESTRGH